MVNYGAVVLWLLWERDFVGDGVELNCLIGVIGGAGGVCGE